MRTRLLGLFESRIIRAGVRGQWLVLIRHGGDPIQALGSELPQSDVTLPFGRSKSHRVYSVTPRLNDFVSPLWLTYIMNGDAFVM
jgi:hypothetical protein